MKLHLPLTVPHTMNTLFRVSNSSTIPSQHRKGYIMLLLVPSGNEMTHHIQLVLEFMNYCILYPQLVVPIKEKSMGKKSILKLKHHSY